MRNFLPVLLAFVGGAMVGWGARGLHDGPGVPVLFQREPCEIHGKGGVVILWLKDGAKCYVEDGAYKAAVVLRDALEQEMHK
jgi:hypothetical protein